MPDVNRQTLRNQNLWLMGDACVVCGEPATDMHEPWIPKGAVMAQMKDKRRRINHIYNTVMLCNRCNTEITHEAQVKARRAKLRITGLDMVIAWGFDPSEFNDDEFMELGIVLVQSWINAMHMKTRYDVRSMAEYV